MSKIIQLTKGAVTVVDDADYEWLSQWKWYLTGKGYAVRDEGGRDNRTNVYMHRRITNAPAGVDVDHVNGDKLNNTRINLRLCTHSQNVASRDKYMGRVSIYKGVNFDKRIDRWWGQIKVNGRRYWLGYHETEELAARSYDLAALEHFGEFARLNFPQESSNG